MSYDTIALSEPAYSPDDLALIDAGRHPISPGADVAEVRWFARDDLPTLADGQDGVVAYGLQRLRATGAGRLH